MEPTSTSQPIRAVVRGLGPAIVGAAILALGVARFEVARDEQEFSHLQAEAQAAGSPGGLPARATAAMLFWRVGNPEKETGKDRPDRREGDEGGGTRFQAQVRRAARALRAAGEESGNDVRPFLPSRAELEAIASCTSTEDPLCASVVEKLERGCASEQVACTLPP